MDDEKHEMPESSSEATLSPATDDGQEMLSPTLREARAEWKPTNPVACMRCPHAMWLQTGTDLKAYCRMMFRISWARSEPVEILRCDGVHIETAQQQAL